MCAFLYMRGLSSFESWLRHDITDCLYIKIIIYEQKTLG